MNTLLKQFVQQTLRPHAMLVSAGIPSYQALEIITNNMQTQNLKDCFLVLKLNEIDVLVDRMKDKVYALSGKKATYKVGGFYPYREEVRVILVDSVLEVDSVDLTLDTIPEQLRDDLLKTIRDIL